MARNIMANSLITCEVKKTKKGEKHTIISIDQYGKVVSSVIHYNVAGGKVSVSDKEEKLSPHQKRKVKEIALQRANSYEHG